MSDTSIYLGRFKNFLQYFGATLFVALIQIAINPLLAKNLSPEDYAIIGYFTSFNLLLTPFITFYLTNFFIQRYFMTTEKDRIVMKRTVMQMLVYFSFFLSLLSYALLYIYHVCINKGSAIAFSPYALYAVFAIPLTGIYSLKLAELRLNRAARSFAIYTILVGLLTAGLSILFVVLMRLGAQGRLFAPFFSNLLVFAYVLYVERDCMKQPFTKGRFKEVLTFCWPLTIAGMLGFFSTGYDRVLLERLGNLAELGYYSIAVQMAGYLSVFSNAVNATFQPDIYESFHKKDYRHLILYISIIVGSVTVVAFVFIAFAPLIIDILTAGRYVYSAGYSRIIALSTITSAIYFSSCQVTIAMGYTKMLLFVKIVGGCIIVLLFRFLIGHYGFWGGAWGNVLSFFIFFLVNLCFLFIRRIRVRESC